MPLYNNTIAITAVAPGDSVAIVSAEQLGAGNFSAAVFCGGPYGLNGNVGIQFQYASTPSSVQYDIYGAFDDTPSAYFKIGTTSAVAGDMVSINVLGGGQKVRFIRVKEVTAPGVNATVKVFG